MPNISYNKRFEPTYDNDLIPKWYFDNKLEAATFMVGEVRSYMGGKVPEGWLLCDGSLISRNEYSRLFGVIGTQYGIGDGISTFEIPTIADSVSVLEYKIIKY